MNHKWPKDEEHLWSPWYPNTPQMGKTRPTQYRSCLHPECKKTEYRQAPSA